MNYFRLDREKLVDWLSGNLQVELQVSELPTPAKALGSNEIFIVLPDNTERYDLPVIAVPQAGMQEFFAFVSTYAVNLRPLSAFYHVVSLEQLGVIISAEKNSTLHTSHFDKLIGVSFIEAFVNASGRLHSLNDLSVLGVKATLSASLMKAVADGYSCDILPDVASRWQQVRRLTGGASTAVPSEDVLAIWEVVSQALHHSPKSLPKKKQNLVLRALNAALRENTPFDIWFPKAVKEALGADLDISALKASREVRVRALPHLLDKISESRIDADTADFLAGGLLSMIGNGSMSHIGLLEIFFENRPRAAMWFGAISGLHSQSDVLSTANCLGNRVLRDLREVRSVFQPPECDIGVNELEVLGGRAFGNESIRTGQSGTIVVGLVGNINGWFKNPSTRDESSRLSREEQEAILVRERNRLDELKFLLDRAARITSELNEPRQSDLFDRFRYDSRKKR